MDTHKEWILLNSSDTEYMLLFDFTSAWIPICNMSFKLSLQEYEIYIIDHIINDIIYQFISFASQYDRRKGNRRVTTF